MKTERLERKIEKLKEENASLKQENQKLREFAVIYEEKEKVLDRTIDEYTGLVQELLQARQQYKELLGKLRQYDGKMMRKYNKAVNGIIKRV